MSIPKKTIVKSVKRNWFWIALIIIVFFGYTFGKDRALGDNAKTPDAATENSNRLSVKAIRQIGRLVPDYPPQAG